MTPPRLTIAARYLFPVEGSPIANGRITIEQGRITEIASGKSRKPDVDLGNVAILPGFVNTHTHLELSSIETDVPSLGIENEIDWLGRVIAQRRGGSMDTLRNAVERNLRSAIAAGTTLIADTTTAGLSWPMIAEAPIRAVVFTEIIGLKRSRGMDTVKAAFEWLASIRPEIQVLACARPGLSPHAPYSTAGWVYQRAAAANLPLSTHIAEMPEELQLLERRDGPLKQFLMDLGAWDDDWEALGPRPSDYVRKGDLRKADWVIAHGNYLDPEDFWQLRPQAALGGHRVGVAYCPRTHAKFGHRPHPYRRMMEQGAVVCLGTDSLASTPSLSILDEMRFLHRLDPSLNGPLLLTMATLFGAWTLRADTVTGSLKVGKSADFAVIALPDRHEFDPHALILDSDLPVVATFFEGQIVAGADRWPGLPSSRSNP